MAAAAPCLIPAPTCACSVRGMSGAAAEAASKTGCQAAARHTCIVNFEAQALVCTPNQHLNNMWCIVINMLKGAEPYGTWPLHILELNFLQRRQLPQCFR